LDSRQRKYWRGMKDLYKYGFRIIFSNLVIVDIITVFQTYMQWIVMPM
jgi:hypothetical protein